MESARNRECLGAETLLSARDVVLEFAMNALRLDAGFTVAGFREATGLPFGAAAEAISASIDRGLLEIDRTVIRATPRGQRYLDELLQYWLAEEPRDAGIG
jgi:oxygen-independent coproporphyrinogen-3 oxidase